MKKIIIFIGILILIRISSFSQTTMEEYNYVTKGYQVQVESGLDMKKGYFLEEVLNQKTIERNAQLKVLYRASGSAKIIAAYMVVYSEADGTKEYLCIPHPNSDKELLDKFWNDLHPKESGDQSMRLQMIAYLISGKLVW